MAAALSLMLAYWLDGVVRRVLLPGIVERDGFDVRTAIGAVLRMSTCAVTPDTSVRDTFAVLRAEDRRSIPVIDEGGSVVGVVDEMRCRESLGPTAASVMSSKLSLDALTPVRRAVELMAAAHLREVTVLDDEGRPLGVLRDVDALLWLANAKRR